MNSPDTADQPLEDDRMAKEAPAEPSGEAPTEAPTEAQPGRRPRVALVGLGETARALALALQRVKTDYEIVGHDRDGARARAAVADGLIDRAEWNLFDAVEPADLIVLGEAPDALVQTLEHIAPHLRPGALVTDLLEVKAPVMALAARVVPAGVSFVGGHLVIEPTRVARAMAAHLAARSSRDAHGKGVATDGSPPLVGATWCLAPAPDASDEAVRVLVRLVRAVGAEALFIDPQEHDALVAGASLMPRLVSAALLRLVSRSPSADDLRRLADPRWRDGLGGEAGADVERLAATPAMRAGLLRWLDGLSGELDRVRAALSQPETADEALAALAEETRQALAEWEGAPEPNEQADIIAELSPRNTMRRLLFGGRRRDRRAPRDSS